LKSVPRALHKESTLKEKKKFNLPQVTNRCWTLSLYIGLKANKRIPSNLEANLLLRNRRSTQMQT
jgi:hypothetical protein